ncbi:MAG: response regulator transcription factor [Proteobacteria bacterium]|nr:response regulator transcription factor [Pseudomonadota bacterium]
MSDKILIVEDHIAVRKSLRNWLESEFPHILVREAGSGEEAVSIVKKDLHDIIIMDIGLPNMNGIEAVRQIKSYNDDARIVMLTIHEDEVHRRDAEASGADAYVPKRMLQTELLPVLEILFPRNGRKYDI